MLIQPLNFIAKYNFGNTEVLYENINEIVQGGPELGTIYINKENIYPKLRFGGPLYFYNNKIFLPKYVGGWFILASINLLTKEIISYGNKEPLILIFKID